MVQNAYSSSTNALKAFHSTLTKKATSKSPRTQTMLLPAESLKLTAAFSLSGSKGLRNMAVRMLFAIESHSSWQRACSNQSMKPTAPDEMTTSVFATTPCRGLSLSR
jgi:hypothetical protein